jgi:hypothetical protein
VFHLPSSDPETLPSSTGGYFWRLEGSRNTLVLLKNMTEEPQRYTLTVRHAEGAWAPGLQTLAPMFADAWISPSYALIAVNGTVAFDAWEVDEDACCPLRLR